MKFLMTGGGTGGHVIPALAVARELRARGHEVFFVGTVSGLEARLVPAHGFPIDWIEIGGLKRVGLLKTLRTVFQLPLSTFRVWRMLGDRKPGAVFSTGGYVAGPVMLAAWSRGVPIVIMEPNAVPGMTNRCMGRIVAHALVNFEETANYFPPGKTERTGVPVRPEFFSFSPKPPSDTLNLLITGGSQGSRTLNRAARESWPIFRASGLRIRMVLQTGPAAHADFQRDFAGAGIEGEVVPFIDNMPAAFAAADLIVCRSGAGAVAELAAAGKPSILVPFPFAADQHQLRNAEVMVRAGAARLVEDPDMTGQRLFDEVRSLASDPQALERMASAARKLAAPRAAEKAADIVEEAAARRNAH